jgi:hypothetical protein
MAALYDDYFCVSYKDFFSVCEPSSHVAVSYSHPVIDYCIENNVLMICDANHDVDVFNNPFYASLHKWFLPTNIWNRFQQIHSDKVEKNELINKRRANIAYEEKRYIKKYANRVNKLLEFQSAML